MLSDETKLQVQALLVSDVLCSFTDGTLSIASLSESDSDHSHNDRCVLLDTLELLKLPEMNTRLAFARMTDELSEEGAMNPAQKARNELLSKISHKATTQSIVPTLAELRQLAASRKLPIKQTICETLACVCGLEVQVDGASSVLQGNIAAVKKMLVCVIGDEQVIDEIAFDVCSVAAEGKTQAVAPSSKSRGDFVVIDRAVETLDSAISRVAPEDDSQRSVLSFGWEADEREEKPAAVEAKTLEHALEKENDRQDDVFEYDGENAPKPSVKRKIGIHGLSMGGSDRREKRARGKY
jgi:hypothetical protein